MKTIRRSALLLAALLPLGACGDSTGSNRLSGSTSFSYSGSFSGTFQADGSPLRNFETGSYAFGQAGMFSEDEQAFTLFAQQGLSGNTIDNLLLSLENPAVGTVTCALDATDCPFGGFLVLGANGTDPEEEPDAFLFSSGGTMTITRLTDKRAQGTFSMVFTDLLGQDGPRVQVTSGTFDVPLFDDSGIGFSRAAAARARFSRSR
ncbi:MAG TPA: hypothetical protein VF665_05010 [Longimicrobium sp.]|uniref:hypothetical protein n=1 Tax=Longimicrobium sp. TaxID=2029185 RepID=UPI002ED7B81D